MSLHIDAKDQQVSLVVNPQARNTLEQFISPKGLMGNNCSDSFMVNGEEEKAEHQTTDGELMLFRHPSLKTQHTECMKRMQMKRIKAIVFLY